MNVFNERCAKLPANSESGMSYGLMNCMEGKLSRINLSRNFFRCKCSLMACIELASQ